MGELTAVIEAAGRQLSYVPKPRVLRTHCKRGHERTAEDLTVRNNWKACQKYRPSKHRRGRYGMHDATFHTLLAAQGGLCAICHNPPNGKAKERELQID